MIKTIVILVVLMNMQVVHHDVIKFQAIDQKPNLVLLGDSITSENKDWASFPANHCYANLLKDWWRDKVNVINEGLAGSAFEDADIRERATFHHPKYIIVLYGLNDLSALYNSDPQQFYIYYNERLDEILEQNPNVTIFLSTITWTSLAFYPEEKQVEFKDIIVQIAIERHLTLANLWNEFYQNCSLLCDGAHTNEKGANVIAETFNETFYHLINGSPFKYVEEVQVQKRFNVNLNLMLTVNISEETSETKEGNADSIFPTIITFMFSHIIAISLLLLNERKNKTRTQLVKINRGDNSVI